MKITSIFLLLSISVFSQKSIKVKFNLNGKIYKQGTEKLDTLNTLKANIKTKTGCFSLVLIDNNKNGVFNDYTKESDEMNYRGDGIMIGKYKSNYIQTIFDPVPKLSIKNKFLFNGYVVELINLKKSDTENYIASLNILKNSIDYNKLFDEYCLNYVDRINNVDLFDAKTNRKVNLKKIKYINKLFLMPITTDLSIESPNFNNIADSERLKLKNIKIIYVIIGAPKKIIKDFILYKNLKYPVYYINDYKSFFLLGFNEIHRGILYDKGKKIVNDGIFPFDLSKYDN